jgi:3'(2'), 5'-bisphosphate nucleotidase
MLEKIIDIAIKAGALIMDAREKGFETQTKSDSFDFVTSADLASEKYILEELKKEFPNDSILSEEGGGENNNSRVWMIDPLDGTKDFKNGGSGFSVMIGLCINGEPSLGVVFGPAKKLLYYAEKGKGAFQRVNGENQKLQVNEVNNLNDSRMIVRIMDEEKRRAEAEFFVSSNPRTSKWDTCAPQAILEEAGGKVTDQQGNPLNYNQTDTLWGFVFIASNKALLIPIVEKIKQFYSNK